MVIFSYDPFMRTSLLAGIIIPALGFFGCVPQRMGQSDAPSSTEQRTYMEQQVKFEQLRSEMAPIVRQISVVLPLDCNTALAKISDVQTRETLMDIAAMTAAMCNASLAR